MKFKNKTVLITGSGTGIGKAIAMKFAENGSSVIILGRRKEPLEDTANILSKIITKADCGASVHIFSGVDVSDESSITNMFDTLESKGIIVDVIINNAGVSGPVTCFSNISMDDFKNTIDIHLTGTFWTSLQALRVLPKGGKIITITTFFTEERPLEQRPYRFRTPYTASQGAKNRLAEALSWELVERGIISLATNPGPVHSDRIYKTVYPKAAAEFMRVGGFEDLNPQQTEFACKDLVQLLGEDESVVKTGIQDLAKKMDKDVSSLDDILFKLLEKIQYIAEKIQKNTSNMIVDNQFLSQEQVAKTILFLADDDISTILNGKIVPGDRVFYPVKSHTSATPPIVKQRFDSKTIVFIVDNSNDMDRIVFLGKFMESLGAKIVCLVSESSLDSIKNMIKNNFHMHECDMSIQQITRWLNAANTMNPIAGVVHLTGNISDKSLVGLSRKQWDMLVDKFINTPAKSLQSALEILIPGGSSDPRLYKEKFGRIIIIGPDMPKGKKILAIQRARVDVFRGALRPFTTTINQEFNDVLKSKIRSFLILPGSIDGIEPDNERLANLLQYLLSSESTCSSEVIFTPDEYRK